MNRNESLNLDGQGLDAWNVWAEEMLAQREKLIDKIAEGGYGPLAFP